MTSYNLKEIAEFTNGVLSGNGQLKITDISFDSRKLVAPRNSIFFAFKSQRNDGHDFIKAAYDKGVRAFVVHTDYSSDLQASFIRVADPFSALQRFSKSHRNRFQHQLIGITGSNGKTTVKEWLYRIISPEFSVSASPRSYNSQLGVPLSLLGIDLKSDLAIIEAGVSEVGEMEKLERIISPEIGIFTNVGDAHSQNFEDRKQLVLEKAVLFKNAKKVIVCGDHKELITALSDLNLPLISWGKEEKNTYTVSYVANGSQTDINLSGKIVFSVPFRDQASIENCIHIIVCSLEIGVSERTVRKGLLKLEPLEMRLQVLNGINNSIIINDAYTADIKALESSLDLASTYAQNRSKTLLISEFPQEESHSYENIKKLIREKQIDRLITIGMNKNFKDQLCENHLMFSSKADFLSADINALFKNEVVIIKGTRSYKLETIAERLQLKDHQTTLEINLDSFTENLNFYKTKISPETKIMAMVKAFSYGSGAYAVASHLESLGVDYLAVAYTDEGVVLRKNGIKIPILVLNPEPSSFASIIQFDLEPEIYSIPLLNSFLEILKQHEIEEYPIHLKLDTGMHRLGMNSSDLDVLSKTLSKEKRVKVSSIFSHLAASESQEHDDFTRQQISLFTSYADKVVENLDYAVDKHICNSAGITRFPEAHLDMIRLGISLYGISTDANTQAQLSLAGSLKTTIIQTRHVSEGESIGYGRRFIAEKDMKIGVIPIGYADGLFRALGNGKYNVKIAGHSVPIIGNICMDMSFIDLTDRNAKTGDEVSVYETPSDVKSMAEQAGTIPYEILSAISHRVKRTYFTE